MTTKYSEIFWWLLDPWQFMFISLSYLPSTAVRLVRTRGLFSLATLQSEWFSDFWAWAGPGVRDSARPKVIPLLQGRVHAGRAVDHEAHPPASGIVLEVGPGSGMWAGLLASTAATRIIGVEPNTAVHPALKAAVKKHDLESRYEVVPQGIEALADSGVVAEGEVDCIVSILCLCSIPDPEHNMRQLYRFLKPGGRWYLYEHVRCEHNRFMVLYQALVNIFWPRVIGGCQLRRRTGELIRAAGDWSDVDLKSLHQEPWYNTVPHILGIATK
ncbi:hypothetical protein MCOR02_010880 [Pyricularia oryzae]|uniref:Methyltransferase type 11 domain-containing protein n=4 Tax=Pyricularia oryzae TaxID=318829 RepID=G4MZZ6_PYRO7|nr:uncharacterized protein MGG_06161 [Pyricularia oryzae 70-15]ELQ42834.1 hypothetical protein OOU_Y34scaffold00192g19 [Pyricularia oryzae Y34]KAH9428320.1 hypothetical protein MCOR02_010880 [Pyricularia oryzae]EHA52234.1 hypothetical protein MGG_06161 [Pyricularia oryzae 70-15]KAI6306627.1 hypothetical protein MCOR34_007934 [Pyricularia oryzae]KAI6456337.1 hypothetical protein MCOR17_008277 [Pyricularia oryzae]